MPDVVSPQRRSAMMGRVGSAHTKPEMAVRRLLHSMGYRYRLHGKDLPGRPDIVFRSRKKAVEVRGCFWHQHPDPGCTKTKLPETRREWWMAKLQGNAERDERNLEKLAAMDWEVLVVWECEIGDAATLRRRLVEFLHEMLV